MNRIVHDFTDWQPDTDGFDDAIAECMEKAERRRAEDAKIAEWIRRIRAEQERPRAPLWALVALWGAALIGCVVWVLAIKAAFDLFWGL